MCPAHIVFWLCHIQTNHSFSVPLISFSTIPSSNSVFAIRNNFLLYPEHPCVKVLPILCHYVHHLCFSAFPFELVFINLFAANLGILNSFIKINYPGYCHFLSHLPGPTLWPHASCRFTKHLVHLPYLHCHVRVLTKHCWQLSVLQLKVELSYILSTVTR
jgi:hypothetical protein